MSMPNTDLAYAVLDQIDAHPDQWNQAVWISPADCGTAGCFAGWTCMLSGDKPRWNRVWPERTAQVFTNGDLQDVPLRAADLLGLPEDDTFDLFEATNTREDLGRLVAEIFGPRPDGAA